MTTFNASEPDAFDSRLNDSLSEAEHEGVCDDNETMRSARIDEYVHESLHDELPLVGSFGPLTGGLLRFAQRYEQFINKQLDLTNGAVHDSPELNRSIVTLLNLTRQAERNVNLMNQVTKDQRRTANNRAHGNQAAVPSTTKSMRRSR